jgi:RNA polymerase sigma-70 factor, ECF subfamily
MLSRARFAENLLKPVARVEPENEPDERLLVEAAQRDPARFAELYERNFARVYAYIARRVGNREEAQELTAEVFHQALANLARFEWRGVPFAVWLFKIAANALVDRSARARGNPSAKPAEEINDSGEFDFEEIEAHARLFQLVKRLPADQRRVVEMRFAEEKSIREIARVLRRTEGAVKQLQFRALETLRARVGMTPEKKARNLGKANG